MNYTHRFVFCHFCALFWRYQQFCVEKFSKIFVHRLLKDLPHAVASAICACVEGRIVPSPLARNPFGGFVLFLAAERKKVNYHWTTTSFKTEEFTFLSKLFTFWGETRSARFVGAVHRFFFSHLSGYTELSKSISGSPPKTAYEVVSSTIYTDHPGENLVQKHKTIKTDVVGEQPAARHIQISWKD